MVKRRKKVSFIARKTMNKPVRVRFINSRGELVSFKATKKIKVPKRVTFYIKSKKKRKW